VGVEYAVLGFGVGWCCGVSLMVGWLVEGIVGGLSILTHLVWLLTFWALIIVVLIAALSVVVVVVVIVLPLVVIGTLLLLIPPLILIIELTIILLLLLPVAIVMLLGVHMIVITVILPLVLAFVFVPSPAAATIIWPVEGSIAWHAVIVRRSCCVGVHFVYDW
jgi:hypothetical protein